MDDSSLAKPPRMDAWVRLQKASTAVLDRVEAKLKADGYPPLSWYDVLLELRRADQKTLRPVEIEKRILLAQYNVSRLIDRLVAASFAEKLKAPNDGRGVVVRLTSQGEELLSRMWPAYEAAVKQEFSEKMTDADADDLMRVLGKVLP
ncbi:MAG: MarR family winged helix-turn-helix transcriptional regulator [Roseibium sp.]